jgi:hypothetical protein
MLRHSDSSPCRALQWCIVLSITLVASVALVQCHAAVVQTTASRSEARAARVLGRLIQTHPLKVLQGLDDKVRDLDNAVAPYKEVVEKQQHTTSNSVHQRAQEISRMVRAQVDQRMSLIEEKLNVARDTMKKQLEHIFDEARAEMMHDKLQAQAQTSATHESDSSDLSLVETTGSSIDASQQLEMLDSLAQHLHQMRQKHMLDQTESSTQRPVAVRLEQQAPVAARENDIVAAASEMRFAEAPSRQLLEARNELKRTAADLKGMLHREHSRMLRKQQADLAMRFRQLSSLAGSPESNKEVQEAQQAVKAADKAITDETEKEEEKQEEEAAEGSAADADAESDSESENGNSTAEAASQNANMTLEQLYESLSEQDKTEFKRIRESAEKISKIEAEAHKEWERQTLGDIQLISYKLHQVNEQIDAQEAAIMEKIEQHRQRREARRMALERRERTDRTDVPIELPASEREAAEAETSSERRQEQEERAAEESLAEQAAKEQEEQEEIEAAQEEASKIEDGESGAAAAAGQERFREVRGSLSPVHVNRHGRPRRTHYRADPQTFGM